MKAFRGAGKPFLNTLMLSIRRMRWISVPVPHVAVRHYVMGDRSYDEATKHDMAAMRDITRDALDKGRWGFERRASLRAFG